MGGLLLGELHCVGVVLLVVAQVKAGNHVVQRILGLRSQNEPIDAVHYLPEAKGWTIVSVEHGVADAALRVHVAVVNRSDESDFGCVEGVVARELSVE